MPVKGGRSLALPAFVISVVLIATIGSAGVARADDGANKSPAGIFGDSIQASGGIPGKGQATPAFVAAKGTVAEFYGRVKRGQARLEDFDAQRIAFESAWYGASPLAPTSAEAASQVMWDSNYINMTQYAQSNNYYCGPGATMSALAALGFWTSDDGESLSQSCLAGSCGPGAPNSMKYLETNYFGNTPWYIGPGDWPVPGTLNYWRTGSYTGYYLAQLPSSLQTYKDWIMHDIDYGWPVMPDVQEPAGGTHLWGHPQNLAIGHWITVFGYQQLGGKTDYVDPAANSPLNWSAVQPYNWGYPSTDMYYLLNNNGNVRGIVW